MILNFKELRDSDFWNWFIFPDKHERVWLHCSSRKLSCTVTNMLAENMHPNRITLASFFDSYMKPQLDVIVQPEQYLRFRFDSENKNSNRHLRGRMTTDSHGKGDAAMVYPTVKVSAVSVVESVACRVVLSRWRAFFTLKRSLIHSPRKTSLVTETSCWRQFLVTRRLVTMMKFRTSKTTSFS